MARPLRAGANPDRCPTCGEAMSLPIRGRKTGTWIRTCTADGCRQQTIALEAPAPMARGPLRGGARPVDVELPFAKFKPPKVLADLLDQKSRGAGEAD